MRVYPVELVLWHLVILYFNSHQKYKGVSYSFHGSVWSSSRYRQHRLSLNRICNQIVIFGELSLDVSLTSSRLGFTLIEFTDMASVTEEQWIAMNISCEELINIKCNSTGLLSNITGILSNMTVPTEATTVTTTASKSNNNSWDDATWILTSSFIIFTMQSGNQMKCCYLSETLVIYVVVI